MRGHQLFILAIFILAQALGLVWPHSAARAESPRCRLVTVRAENQVPSGRVATEGVGWVVQFADDSSQYILTPYHVSANASRLVARCHETQINLARVGESPTLDLSLWRVTADTHSSLEPFWASSNEAIETLMPLLEKWIKKSSLRFGVIPLIEPGKETTSTGSRSRYEFVPTKNLPFPMYSHVISIHQAAVRPGYSGTAFIDVELSLVFAQALHVTAPIAMPIGMITKTRANGSEALAIPVTEIMRALPALKAGRDPWLDSHPQAPRFELRDQVSAEGLARTRVLVVPGSQGAVEIRDGCSAQIFPETSQPVLESAPSSPDAVLSTAEPSSPWPLLPDSLKSKLKQYPLPLGIGGKSRIFKGGSDWGDGGNGVGSQVATARPWMLSEPPTFEPTEMEKSQMSYGFYNHHRETYFRHDELCTQSGVILPDGKRAIAMRLSQSEPYSRIDSGLDLFAAFTKDQAGVDGLRAFVLDPRGFVFDSGRPRGLEMICRKSVLGPDLYSLVEPKKIDLWLDGPSPLTPDQVPGVVDETLPAKPFLINRDSQGRLDPRAYESYGSLIACVDGKVPVPGNPKSSMMTTGHQMPRSRKSPPRTDHQISPLAPDHPSPGTQRLLLKSGFGASGAYDISIDSDTVHGTLYFGAAKCRFEGDGFWVNPWTAVVPSPFGWAEIHFDLDNPRLRVFLKSTDTSCAPSPNSKPLWLGRHLWRFDDVDGD